MQNSVVEMRRLVPGRRLVPAYRTKLPDACYFETARYQSVEAMICRMAKRASMISGISFDEMKAQANFLFVLACRRFDEERGAKFSTFFYSVLYNGLVDFGKGECWSEGMMRRVYPSADDPEPDPLANLGDEKASRAFLVSDMYNSLSADEAALVDLVLTGFASSLKHLRALALERLKFEEAQFEEAVEGIKLLVGEMDG